MNVKIKSDKINMKGLVTLNHYRNGNLIDHVQFPNLITHEGKAYLFNAGFNSGTVIPQFGFFIGLVNNTGFTAFAVDDNMTLHPGWTEFIGYSETTRPSWSCSNASFTAPSTTTVASGSAATFTITAATTLKGIFLVSDAVKNATDGILWSGAAFLSPRPVIISDILQIYYQFSA